MSKLSEYSKFDHLDSDSEDDNVKERAPANVPATVAPPLHETASSPDAYMRRDPKTTRFLFQYASNTIYEWEQTLDQVVLYVPPPPNGASRLDCKIGANHLLLGLKGSPPFIDEPTFGTVDIKASTWLLEEVDTSPTNKKKMIAIYLQKANKGTVWDSVLCGQFPNVVLNPVDREQVQKELLLERYQEEHPGFDFRDADFNGSVPDPRTFMGGVKYD